MGKASSSKKVARAARAGGRVSSGQPRSLLFPGIVALVVVLGLALVAYAREDRRNDDLGGTPQIGDHIHLAIGVYACDGFLPDLAEFESPVGVHTHGDGVVHVHPYSQLGAGANATLGRYIDDVQEGGFDFSLEDDELTYQDQTYKEGDASACEGVEDPKLRLAYWSDVQNSDDEPEITTGDFTDLRLTENGGGFTIFYGDAKATIPKPPSSAELAELGLADSGQVPEPEGGSSTTVAGDDATSSTSAGEPSETSTTGAPGEPAPTPAP